LTYQIEDRAADGPIFKSPSMEVKWDIYLFSDQMFFCRSWTGDLVYRATVKVEPSELRVLNVETTQQESSKMVVRVTDFLVKSHVLGAVALHPLGEELGRNAEKLAAYSFGYYGCMGRYGTLEETIGTAYYPHQIPMQEK
jgi:hypothetical protein